MEQIPYIVHEAAEAKSERTIKRLIISEKQVRNILYKYMKKLDKMLK